MATVELLKGKALDTFCMVGPKENDVKDQKISGLYLLDSNIIECIQAHIEDNLKPIFSNILDHDEGFEVLTKFGIHN